MRWNNANSDGPEKMKILFIRLGILADDGVVAWWDLGVRLERLVGFVYITISIP